MAQSVSSISIIRHARKDLIHQSDNLSSSILAVLLLHITTQRGGRNGEANILATNKPTSNTHTQTHKRIVSYWRECCYCCVVLCFEWCTTAAGCRSACCWLCFPDESWRWCWMHRAHSSAFAQQTRQLQSEITYSLRSHRDNHVGFLPTPNKKWKERERRH